MHLCSRSQQGRIGFKEKQDFSSGDRLADSFLSLHQGLMDFVYCLVLSQSKLPNEQHNSQPKGKAC
jgi:hypothetical protein